MKIRNSVEAQGGPVITKQDQDKYRQSTDALGRFLADRRRIFRSLLETRSSIDHHHHHRASPDDEWILQIPSRPLEYLDRQELIAVAQTVDTALFKTFLFTKPALLGPLCRLENWCEVNQVEELLLERKVSFPRIKRSKVVLELILAISDFRSLLPCTGPKSFTAKHLISFVGG